MPVQLHRWRPSAAGPRAGSSTVWIMLIIVGLVTVSGVLGWVSLADDSTGDNALTQEAFTSEFVVDVTEQGEVESANNVEIRCQVKAQGKSGTPILTIVPEGTYVQQGELVCQLDSSALDNEYTSRLIVANKSKATMIQSKNVWDSAKISKIEYEQGTFLEAKQKILSEILVAEEDLRRAEQYLLYSERLAEKGYVTALQLEADRFAVEKSQNDLESAKQRLTVLEKYTRQKQLTTLKADILTAEARYEADKNTYELDLRESEELKEEIEKCTLRAPAAGQVVYANEYDHRGGSETMIEEGAVMRQGQIIVRLPDPANMQVKAKISEARIESVKAGLKAEIRIDAFSDLSLTGAVSRVNEYPEPGSFFSSNVKEYAAWVKIDQSDDRLRPGLTAEVKIEVLRLPSALQIAVQSIYEHGGKHYVFVPQGDRSWIPQLVTLGASNNKFVVIESGLSDGDLVAANPRAHLEQVSLPEIPASERDLKQRREADPAAPPARSPSRQTPAAQPTETKPPGAASGGRPSPQAMMQRLDTDGDGALSSDELSAIPAQVRDRMMKMDTNGDGKLDAAELKAIGSGGGGGGGSR